MLLQNDTAARLTIETIDSVQGLEAAIGITDIPIDGTAGFLFQTSRLVVSHARFRYGLYNLAQKGRTDKLSGFRMLNMLQAQWTAGGHRVEVIGDVSSPFCDSGTVQMGCRVKSNESQPSLQAVRDISSLAKDRNALAMVFKKCRRTQL